MAINKKLIHFKTKAAFEAQLKGSNILDTSIVFIQDAKLIWTHGTYYGKSEIHIGTNEPTNGEIIWINSDTNEIDITVDTINPNTGFFEQNLEWETPIQNTKEIISCACNFVKKYGVN